MDEGWLSLLLRELSTLSTVIRNGPLVVALNVVFTPAALAGRLGEGVKWEDT
jgi:hypothetical protein